MPLPDDPEPERRCASTEKQHCKSSVTNKPPFARGGFLHQSHRYPMQNGSMLNPLLKLLKGEKDDLVRPPELVAPASSRADRGVGLDMPKDWPLADVPRYPPYDKGMPVVPCEQVVASQQELAARLFRTAGVSRAEFDVHMQPVVHNLARYVHLLPASAAAYFRGAGGLFRLALEVGLYSLQGANAAVFPTGGGTERRHHMQPRWAMSVFFAGVCAQLYRTVNSMVVLDRDNNAWSPLTEPLYDWALSQNASHYFIRWMEGDDVRGAQASAAFLVNMILPKETLQYLSDGNNQVVPAMSAAIASAGDTAENVITRIIAPITTRVIEADVRMSPHHYGHLTVGMHLEPHLIDGMRRLYRSGKWVINQKQKGGRLFVGPDGVYLEWETASRELVEQLIKEKFAGIPTEMDTLAELLCAANVFERPLAGGRYWSIQTPSDAVFLENCVRFCRAELIFPNGFDLTPYAAGVALNVAAVTKPVSAGETRGRVPRTGEATTSLLDASSATQRLDVDLDLAAQVRTRPEGSNNSQVPGPQSVIDAPQQNGAQRPDTAEAGAESASAENISPREQKPRMRERAGSANPAGKAEVSTPASVNAEESPAAQRLFDSLSSESAWLMRRVCTAILAGTNVGFAGAHALGFAIANDELNAHGTPYMSLLDDLSKKDWLWVDKTKPQRKMHSLDTAAGKVMAVVLRAEIARALGLPWEGAD